MKTKNTDPIDRDARREAAWGRVREREAQNQRHITGIVAKLLDSLESNEGDTWHDGYGYATCICGGRMTVAVDGRFQGWHCSCSRTGCGSSAARKTAREAAHSAASQAVNLHSLTR
jgi:GH24 family phage-related lysozyme (muramidase)